MTDQFVQSILDKAKKNKQHIVLPEGNEERTIKAADQLLADDVVNLTLIGDPTEIHGLAKSYQLTHLDKANILNPKQHERKQKYAELLLQLRQAKGMTPGKAATLVEDPLYLACLMIKAGDADGEVAGARNFTGDVLRPALQIIKTNPGITCVSGAFLMFTNLEHSPILVFADCAVTPKPTAPELAQIAVSSALTAKVLVGSVPKVAMLSFSTKGSAKHEMVDIVVEATKLAKALDPTLDIDGELQADAALVASVAEKKAPNSNVAGKANVLVFPSLEAGNIGYKLAQRLAGIDAIGPILQGMAAPVNDLSRGCSVQDVYKMVAITAIQAIGNKK
jgi:phosphate acetyltransferase